MHAWLNSSPPDLRKQMLEPGSQEQVYPSLEMLSGEDSAELGVGGEVERKMLT